MRKVTKQAISAFLTDTKFSAGNTSVIVHDNGTELTLHGNCIASKKGNELTITNAGWFSNTTKERLNGLPNVSIYQKHRQWYLNGELWDGKPTKIKLQ